jgi:hypothetical protein
MMLDDLVAVCGYDCADCPAYIATRNNDTAELARLALEWTKALGKTYKPEDILCDGCRVPGGRRVAYCTDCNIRTCALSKGYITCAHCPASPCEKITSPKAREALETLKKTL